MIYEMNPRISASILPPGFACQSVTPKVRPSSDNRQGTNRAVTFLATGECRRAFHFDELHSFALCQYDFRVQSVASAHANKTIIRIVIGSPQQFNGCTRTREQQEYRWNREYRNHHVPQKVVGFLRVVLWLFHCARPFTV
jgi:hypothetical protein